MHQPSPILVSDPRRTPSSAPRHAPVDQEKAAEVREHPAAKAFEKAPREDSQQDRISEAAIDPSLSASDEDWQAAFPGQRVHRRVPNRQRMAMHFARGLTRAVTRGDFEVAVVFFIRPHNVPRSNKGAA